MKGLSSDSKEPEAKELNSCFSAELEVIVNVENSEDDEMIVDEELEEEEEEDISGLISGDLEIDMHFSKGTFFLSR